MHKEILTPEQISLLPLIKKFQDDYILVGGTAIALHIGHRYSIDFDLFTNRQIQRKRIHNIILKSGFSIDLKSYSAYDQLHLVINSVKFTFFNYEEQIPHNEKLEDIITLPNLLDLAAMKTSALGGRAKWKDYVDLYFILKNHYTLNQISQRAEELFHNWFNEKLLRQQLCYFKDIDYRDEVKYFGENVTDEEIKAFLIDVATEEF